MLAAHRHAPAHTAKSGRRRLSIACAIKQRGDKNVVCSKTLVARPETVDRVVQLCQDVTAFSRQQMAVRDNGILSFECVRDSWENNTIHFWERYTSNGHLGRHNTSPTVQQFMEQVSPLLETPVGMALYEYKNGKIGPACVQGGPKGEGGLDDATGASGAAGGASLKQTSGAVDLTQVNEHEDDEELLANFTKGMNKQVEGLKNALSNIFGSRSR